MAVTMQAVSGAGYPGVASLDILGNVIPYIAKEEEKMEEETQKLLGVLNGVARRSGSFAMSAQCNRVAVEDGHTESVAVRFKKKATPEEIIAAWNDFSRRTAATAPAQRSRSTGRVHDRAGPSATALRRRPRRGHDHAVGRLRKCNVLDWKFTVLSHNTIRGAAGAALLNAELLKAKGYLG
jgi:aspartate-semialdehyde dehydrogenase